MKCRAPQLYTFRSLHSVVLDMAVLPRGVGGGGANRLVVPNYDPRAHHEVRSENPYLD